MIAGILIFAGMVFILISIPADATILGAPLGIVADLLGFLLIAIAVFLFGGKNPLGSTSSMRGG